MIRLMCYAHSACTSHDARPHCRLKSPVQGTPGNARINFILPETRVPAVHEGCYSIGLYVFTFTQQFSKSKKMCSKQALTRDPTVFNVSFLENPTEHPHKPYRPIARNQSSCRIFAPLTVCVYLHSFSRNYFPKSHGVSQLNRRKKQNLARNSQSRSLKVIYFGVNGKATRTK